VKYGRRAIRAAAFHTKLSMTVLLELNQVSKAYGALKAVDAVSLTVDSGEALAVIGPNGAGKTTLFNLISGDVTPSGGRMLFAGSDMTTMAPHARSRLGIGRSYQIPHPFANMTVFENLLVGAIFGGGVAERASYQRCSDVLKLTGLYDKANVPARTLTLLQRKRLEMARALAIQPKLLLLDEIAGGLTEYECGELVKTIKEIHARGTTIVWIEHIVHALVSVANRLIVMNFGQVLAQGDPREVMADARVREVYMGIPAS
jgi:branched-chain amino acid transport system ATP-binding protein